MKPIMTDIPITEACNKYQRLEERRLPINAYLKIKAPSKTMLWNALVLFLWLFAFCLLFLLVMLPVMLKQYDTVWRKYSIANIGLQQLQQHTISRGFSNDIKSEADPDKVVSCYYNFPRESGTNQLMPSDIHPYLCTHINVAFAQIVNKEIKLENYQYKTLLDIVKLKNINPNLKILVSVGGSGNDSGFSDMVIDHASRKTFIKSIKQLLRNYTLDGIDLDWEFPALHKMELGGRERQHFSQLLREIRMEYIREKRPYILTIAAAAPQIIVDVSYDIDQVNQYVDFVNIMTYDYHFYTKYTPFTGFNAPLYPRTTEHLYLATLNINYTVQMYVDKGLDRNKIVVGIPTYGHTFTLVNANNHRVGSPASGYGSLGSSGFINYPDVCSYLTNFTNNVTVEQDKEAKVPYLYSNKEWVSYDSPQSVMEKAKYIKDNKLRGAMIYSLNADDFEGVCDSGLGSTTKFPLSLSVFIICLKESQQCTSVGRWASDVGITGRLVRPAVARLRRLWPAARRSRARPRRHWLFAHNQSSVLIHTEPHAPHTLYF